MTNILIVNEFFLNQQSFCMILHRGSSNLATVIMQLTKLEMDGDIDRFKVCFSFKSLLLKVYHSIAHCLF